MFKQRVIDCFVKEWQCNVDRSAVLDEYKLYKNIFSFEAYLLCVPKDLKMYLTRFLTLRIQTGRYENNKIARNERYCLYCGSRDIVDTYHFICICYSTLRSRFIDNVCFVRPSVFNFNLPMGSNNKNVFAGYKKFHSNLELQFVLFLFLLCQALNNNNVCALIYVLYRFLL